MNQETQLLESQEYQQKIAAFRQALQSVVWTQTILPALQKRREDHARKISSVAAAAGDGKQLRTPAVALGEIEWVMTFMAREVQRFELLEKAKQEAYQKAERLDEQDRRVVDLGRSNRFEILPDDPA